MSDERRERLLQRVSQGLVGAERRLQQEREQLARMESYLPRLRAALRRLAAGESHPPDSDPLTGS